MAVQRLENKDAQYVFGILSEENLDLLEFLRKSQIRLVLTRHEQSVGSMTAAYERLTGKTGVSLSTLGLGAINLVAAGAYAYLGSIPVLMITGQKLIKKSKQSRLQILDMVGIMQLLTKYTCQLVSTDNIPSRVYGISRLAEEEKPGAMRLELPEDIAAEQTDNLPTPLNLSHRPLVEYKAICAAMEKLRAACNPILVVGAEVNYKMTAKVLKQLIDETGIPLVTIQMGKDVVDERHPYFLGDAALSAGDFVHRIMGAADLIVNVGHDVAEKSPFFMTHGGTEAVHVNFRSAEADPVYFLQTEVMSDVANAIWQTDEALGDTVYWDFTRLSTIHEASGAQIVEGADDPRFPLHSQHLIADVHQALSSQDIAALNNGMYKVWFARNYKAHIPNTVLLDNALAAMGAGLPSAMAAHLIYPDRPIVAVYGDGGFMMSNQELEATVQLRMNLTVIILRDNGHGMIRWKQSNMGFVDFGLDYGDPDFVHYTEAYGAHDHRIDSAEGFPSLLEHYLGTSGVRVIDCPVDYSENNYILNVRLREHILAI